MDEYQKYYAEWETSDKSLHPLCSHLYEILENETLWWQINDCQGIWMGGED